MKTITEFWADITAVVGTGGDLDPKTRALLKMRDHNTRLLATCDAAKLLQVIMKMQGARAHGIGCDCGGVNESTGLSCYEVWTRAKELCK